MKLLNSIANTLRRFWGLFLPEKRTHRFYGVEWYNSGQDENDTLHPGKLVIIGSKEKAKWIRFICPCGCGEVQALNLMKSHWPHWTMVFHDRNTISVQPSVHALKCGAHFWIQRNKIHWY